MIEPGKKRLSSTQIKWSPAQDLYHNHYAFYRCKYTHRGARPSKRACIVIGLLCDLVPVTFWSSTTQIETRKNKVSPRAPGAHSRRLGMTRYRSTIRTNSAARVKLLFDFILVALGMYNQASGRENCLTLTMNFSCHAVFWIL